MAIRVPRRRRVLRKRKALRKGKKGMRKMRMSSMNALKDRARVVEVSELPDISGNTGAGVIHTLSMFARANAVSKNFRFYRCTKVELDFIPYANLFAPGTAFPELYYQSDKTYSLIATQNPTLQSMEGRGVLPVKWTSPIKRWYKPAVLRQENLLAQGYYDGTNNLINTVQPLTSTPVYNKWYMTETAYNAQQFSPTPPGVTTVIGPAVQPNKLQYHGCAFFVNTPVAPGSNIGRIVIRTHWEFKEPFVAPSTSNISDISGNNIHIQA